MTTNTVTESTVHLTASAVVIDPATGKVLLIWHQGNQRLMFPGGHVDDGEDASDAAIREVLEETGAVATLVATHDVARMPDGGTGPAPWAVEQFPAPAFAGDAEWPAEPAHHHLDSLYIAVGDSSQPLTPQLNEVDSAGWYDIDDLPGLPVRGEVPARAADAWRQLQSVGAAS